MANPDDTEDEWDDDDYQSFGPDYDYDDDDDGANDFADPTGHSALRASSESNPRNLPCPNCEAPDVLTRADVARGYQCDACADRAERGDY